MSKQYPNVSIHDLYVRAVENKSIIEEINTYDDATWAEMQDGYAALAEFRRFHKEIDNMLKEVVAA